MRVEFSCQRGLRRGLSLILGIAGTVTALFLLLGCQDILNAMLDSAAPTGMSASDGDYPDRIQVSWGAPSLSGDKWKGYEIAGYNVTWNGPTANPGMIYGTSCSIHIDNIYRATKYTVTVETRFSPSSPTSSGGSVSDDGFAIDTENLVWYDGSRDHTMAGSDRWYVTMFQKGFINSFVFPSAIGTVDFYKHKTLDLVHASSSPASVQSWTCDADGAGHKFYVRVQTNSPTFRASYGF